MPDGRKPLMIPPAAEADDHAVEMLRAWIADGGLHCVLNVGHWHKNSDTDERPAWGIMLADVAQHISNALQEVVGLDRRDSLRIVVETFNREIRQATSDLKGMWPTMNDPPDEFWDNDDES